MQSTVAPRPTEEGERGRRRSSVGGDGRGFSFYKLGKGHLGPSPAVMVACSSAQTRTPTSIRPCFLNREALGMDQRSAFKSLMAFHTFIHRKSHKGTLLDEACKPLDSQTCISITIVLFLRYVSSQHRVQPAYLHPAQSN
jgi:hypothetical protein